MTRFTASAISACAAIAALGLGATAASAGTNLVTNGSFETGDFSGFTVTNSTTAGNPSTNTQVQSGAARGGPNSGAYYATFGDTVGETTISQTFSDRAGADLLLSFYFKNTGGVVNNFRVAYNGDNLFTFDNTPASSSYIKYTTNLVATGSDTIDFTGSNGPAFDDLDDVDVEDVSEAPEPASWALLMLGVAMLGRVASRNKRRLASPLLRTLA